MTTDSQQPTSRRRIGVWIILILLALIPILYSLTLAHSLVFGDPTEYTFVANILGIAHPPGYAFFTLFGKLFQTLIPIGEIPWRMHLLSAAAATLGVLFVYGTVQTVAAETRLSSNRLWGLDKIVALFATLTIATAADWWQHAIHANPHIVTATFLAANLFFLTKWSLGDAERGRRGEGEKSESQPGRVDSSNKWLFAFCLSAGLGVTHHPLTVFSFLAYGTFILWVRPGIWREWRTLLTMAGFFLLGLAVWLYFPIRSAMEPEFGPSTMNTLNGFLDHVLGRGITESLPFFGLGDQLDRATVFWTLLRMQYSLPVIFLSIFGLIWLALDKGARGRGDAGTGRYRSLRPLALLYGLALLSNYLFIINLRQQDIMAYLLGVFLVIGLLAGVGLWGLLALLQQRFALDWKAVGLLLGALFLLGPMLQIVRNFPQISLVAYDEAELYKETVFEWFDDQDEGAILLNDWEHMTPLWYAKFVEDRWPDPADVEPILVSTDKPWLESVFEYLPAHPVYLSGYRPEIAAAGFRLRPRDTFYQVVQPGDESVPPELTLIGPETAADLELIAYQLPERRVMAGDYVPLTLAMRAPDGTEDYYVPVLFMGEGDESITFEFTTDGHQTTPTWQAGEVIIERFDFTLPHDLSAGTYPLTLGLRNLTKQENTDLALALGELIVSESEGAKVPKGLLANFRQRAGLASASARVGLIDRREAPWSEPIHVRPGDTVHMMLEWESLAPAEESYTVFLHLIDLGNQPLVALDYTPLGGSTPTHLWIPKWLPGQRMLDPYQLEIPEDLPPGDYLIEAGLYEMTGNRRLHLSDAAGNLVGDRYILGPIHVGE